MAPLTQTKKSIIETKDLLVVMVLSKPPSPGNVTDWYWKKIAGVPFLLRNILSIQQAGARRLILLAEKGVEMIDELCRRVENDPRVLLNLKCHTDSEDLVASAQNDHKIVFLDGSHLHHPERLEMTLKHGGNQTLSLGLDDFESFLQGIDDRGLFSRLGNIRDIPRKISPNPGITLSFVTATEEWRISRPNDFYAVSDRLIKSCGLTNDSLMDQWVTRFISRQLTQQIIKTPITPNMITLVSFLVGLASAACFLLGDYGMGVAGAGLLLLSIWIDCTDGEVARLKFMESSFGKQLDIICDNLVHMGVFFSIGVGLYYSTGQNLFIVLGSLAVIGCLVSFILLSPEIVKNKTRPEKFVLGKNRNKSFADKLANRDFAYLLFFMALVGRLDFFLGLTAAGANIFAGYLVYNKFKTAPASLRRT